MRVKRTSNVCGGTAVVLARFMNSTVSCTLLFILCRMLFSLEYHDAAYCNILVCLFVCLSGLTHQITQHVIYINPTQ
jgi:hypothetical protein